jgi:HD-GYP domain-containing protein (c-di-GMP phosphodiesterase class II)
MGKPHGLVTKTLAKTISSHYETLVAMMHAYDEHTGHHLCNAEDIVSHVAKKMDLPYHDMVGVTIGALVHDVGKIGVHHSIISKAGPLNPGERILAETHVPIGKMILSHLQSPWQLADYAYMHHERLDGSGYPNNLTADQTPLRIRILAACDVAEALMARRPYRNPCTFSDVVDYLHSNLHQFDAEVIKHIETYKRGS